MHKIPPHGPRPHDRKRQTPHPGGRICDLESTPQTRRLALALGAVLFLIVVVLAKAAIGFAVEAATTRPAACAHLSNGECAARAEDGW